MSAVVVERIELLAIGSDGERVTWSSHLGSMYEALIVARLVLSNGVEAIAGTTTYTEHEFDRTTFHAAALMAPFVLGRDAFDTRAAYADMRKRYVPLGHLATSLFDIALHDGKAKSEDLPLYRMLGANRHEIPAYASSPLQPTDQAYIDYCHDMLNLGYRAVKIHPYCVFDDDMSLIQRLIGEFVESEIKLSMDVDGMYTFDQAFRMGKVLDDASWEFFEAPLPDTDLRGYKALADSLDLDVICGGNSLPHPQLIEFALEMGAWDRSRFDVTGIGGFTGAGDVAEITRAITARPARCKAGDTRSRRRRTCTSCSRIRTAPISSRRRRSRSTSSARGRLSVRTRTASSARAICRDWAVEMDWDRIEPFVYARRVFPP